MERRQLDFAKGPLLGLGLVCVMVAPVFLGLGLDLPPNARLGPLGLLRVFGPDVLSFALLLIAALLVLTGLACFRRLVGGRPAVAIRADGIEFRGLYLSRYIPWKALERIDIGGFSLHGQRTVSIRVRSHCPAGASKLHHFLASLSHGVSEKLILGSPRDMAVWVEQAREAWHEASRPARPPHVRTRIGFGRRLA